jgi:hypothetical protein
MLDDALGCELGWFTVLFLESTSSVVLEKITLLHQK